MSIIELDHANKKCEIIQGVGSPAASPRLLAEQSWPSMPDFSELDLADDNSDKNDEESVPSAAVTETALVPWTGETQTAESSLVACKMGQVSSGFSGDFWSTFHFIHSSIQPSI